MQVELAASSARGERAVVGPSGRMIHHDQPELALDASRRVVNAVRGR